jgi:hypothetical protein
LISRSAPGDCRRAGKLQREAGLDISFQKAAVCVLDYRPVHVKSAETQLIRTIQEHGGG